MYYFQIEFQARERRDELLREARQRRLGRALKSRGHNDGVLGQLQVRRLDGLLKRDPGCEACYEGFEVDGKATSCLAGCTKTTGTL